MSAEQKVDEVLEQRGNEYGDFRTMAQMAQHIKSVILGQASQNGTPFSPEQTEAMEMIILKQCRLACGNPNNLDSWLDIAGYAQLGHEMTATAPKKPGPQSV